MIAVALKGLAGRKVRALLTAFADRHRRRDGQRHVHPHRHDAEVVQRPLHRIGRQDRRRHQRQGGRQELHDRQRRDDPGVAARQGPGAARGRGGRRRGLPAGGQRRRHHRPRRQEGRAWRASAAASTPPTRAFSPLELKTGAWPEGPEQVAIDAGTAAKQHYKVGDSVVVSTLGKKHDYHDQRHGVVRRRRLARLREHRGLGHQDRPDAAAPRGPLRRHLDRREARAPRRRELLRAVKPLLPATLQVKDSAKQAKDDAAELDSSIGMIRMFLLGFGGIALLVGAFVIFNTLSITVAQRTREFATLRTLGASRKQVMRSVVLEGLVIGLLASVIGLLSRARDRQGHGRAVQRAGRRPARRPRRSSRRRRSSSRCCSAR